MLSKEEIQSAIMLANEDADVTTQSKLLVQLLICFIHVCLAALNSFIDAKITFYNNR